MVALALLTVFILVGGQIAYGRFFVERPLLNELQSIPGVTTAKLEKTPAGHDIVLQISAVGNLPSVYQQAKDVARRNLSPDSFTLKIVDNRTPLLTELYWQMQIHIEEAVVQGNFATVAERISDLAATKGVSENFYVDEECIYLELYQDETYLYAVRHRVPPQRRTVTT